MGSLALQLWLRFTRLFLTRGTHIRGQGDQLPKTLPKITRRGKKRGSEHNPQL